MQDQSHPSQPLTLAREGAASVRPTGTVKVLGSTGFIRSDQPDRARTSLADAPSGLDWQSFSARYFPDRRRHDLDALKAYEAYRNRSRPRPKRARREGAQTDRRAQAPDAALVAAAVQISETDGGSAPHADHWLAFARGPGGVCS